MEQKLQNPAYAQYVQPYVSPRHKRLRRTNIGCAASLPFVMFLLIMTTGITLRLALPVLIAGLAIVPLCSLLHEKTGRFRPLLRIAQTIAVGLLAAALAAPFICLTGTRNPQMYRLKWFVYTNGVRESAFVKNNIPPEKLPAIHKDYYFRTEPDMIAQDYTPCAFLFLHTDAETLNQTAERLDAYSGVIREQNTPPDPEDLAEREAGYRADEAYLAHRPDALPHFVYQELVKKAGFQDDLSNAVIYKPAKQANMWYVGSGALINYETGLLVIWV